MPVPHPQDIRDRVVAAVRAGQSQSRAAEAFGVGRRTVVRWMRLMRTEGRIVDRKPGGSRKQVPAASLDQARAILAAEPTLTLSELQRRLAAAGMPVGITVLSRLRQRSGLGPGPGRPGLAKRRRQDG